MGIKGTTVPFFFYKMLTNFCLLCKIIMLIINIDSDVIILIVVLDVINLFVIGYKAFNKDFTNRYGDKFKIGKIYHADGEIKWGNNGNGFHICTNFEECFRYVDSNNFILTEVIGFGKLIKYDDEYNGYFDMYVCENMRIIRTISRKEIIEMAKTLWEDRLYNFIRTFSLTDEEAKEIETVSKDKQKILKDIDYYHNGNKNAYRS